MNDTADAVRAEIIRQAEITSKKFLENLSAEEKRRRIDYFAAHALIGILFSHHDPSIDSTANTQKIASRAYDYAEAILAESERREAKR